MLTQELLYSIQCFSISIFLIWIPLHTCCEIEHLKFNLFDGSDSHSMSFAKHCNDTLHHGAFFFFWNCISIRFLSYSPQVFSISVNWCTSIPWCNMISLWSKRKRKVTFNLRRTHFKSNANASSQINEHWIHFNGYRFALIWDKSIVNFWNFII